MALFGKTLQRKLLGILLLVGFAPAVIVLVYNYSVFALGFEGVIGSFLQDQADAASAKTDAVLQAYYQRFAGLRSGVAEGHPLDPAMTIGPARFQQLLLTDRRGLINAASPETSAIRVELLPGLLRATTASQVLFSELFSPEGKSRLCFQAAVENDRILTGFVNPEDLLQATGEAVGSSFLRLYSNRGGFPGQSEDHSLSAMAEANGRQIREQLSGWFSTGEKRERAGSLVGFAESKLLRIRRNQGTTSVEWITLTRMDVREVSSLLSYMMWRNIFFGMLLAPVLVGLSYLLARRFLAPVRAMHSQARRIGQGDLDATAEVQTGDELEQLAEAFNAMASNLRSSRDSLERYLQSVEKKARQISLANSISRNLIGPFDLQQLCEVTHSELKNLLAYDGLTVVIFAESDSKPSRFWFISDVFAGSPDSEVQSVCESAFGSETTAPFPCAMRLDAPPVKALADLKFEHCCMVPLRAEAGLAGVLALGRTVGPDFSGEESIALEQISGVVAVGIEHIGLYERTRSFALELEQKVEERAAELQRAQEQLFRIERFAATGRLAANIAHEINNPLGVIKNYLHLFRQKQRDLDPSSAEALTIVQEELDRIARIVQNLLEFYRPATARPELLGMNEEIRQIMPLIQSGFGRRQIKLEMQLADSLPTIEMPRDHLRQVLFNLLKNAEEAVEDGGTITLRTSLVSGEGTPCVQLEVCDNGCGIPQEDQAQVFEPFFTRKRDGQAHGTGLGLAVTYSIIQSLNGSIELDSRPGQGTSFKVLLPVSGAQSR
ncbi:MAG: sensor histidine kinase [Candidatus Sumerlaeaceae bacterium]